MKHENDEVPSTTPTPTPSRIFTPASREISGLVSSYNDLINKFSTAINHEGTDSIKSCLEEYREDDAKENTVGLVILDFMRNSSITISNLEKLFGAIKEVFGENFLQDTMAKFVAQRIVWEYNKDEFDRIFPLCEKYTPGLVRRSESLDIERTMDNYHQDFCSGLESALSSSEPHKITEFLETQSDEMPKEVFGAIFTMVIMEFVDDKKFSQAGKLLQTAGNVLGTEWMSDRVEKVRLALGRIGRQNDFAELLKVLPSQEQSASKRLKPEHEKGARNHSL